MCVGPRGADTLKHYSCCPALPRFGVWVVRKWAPGDVGEKRMDSLLLHPRLLEPGM